MMIQNPMTSPEMSVFEPASAKSLRAQIAQTPAANDALRDYETVHRAIAFISGHWRGQPTIEEMAEAVSVTPDELHHLFRRWAGLTPKGFMQAVTLDNAKRLLRESGNILDAAYESGLSGPGRLHDLFVTHEAMSPGEWKKGGAGLTLRYGFHPSPFGTAVIIATARGLAGLAFADPGEEIPALRDMQARWRLATYIEDHAGTAADSDGQGNNLFGCRAHHQCAESITRGRCCGRQESDLVRGTVPSCARQEWRDHRLSLGPDTQARDARLGNSARRRLRLSQISHRYHRRSRAQPVDDRCAGGEFALEDRLG